MIQQFNKTRVPFIGELLRHPNQIAYFAGANNYTWLHFRNGERRLLAKPVTYFEERLPTFIRIHKTSLINPDCVIGLIPPPRSKMAGAVRMLDGTELPVSRRRWLEVAQLLQAGHMESDNLAAPAELPESGTASPGAPPAQQVLAVMAPDALLLTRQCLTRLGLTATLQHIDRGAELATALLLNPVPKRPALILLDARTNRADRMIALRNLKSHPQLRAIPVVWLAAPNDNVTQSYDLGANSVVIAGTNVATFSQAIEQMCRYWLMVVQLPSE